MGTIFPARKSMVSDNLAGSRERDWAFFYSVVNAVMGVHYCTPAVLGKGACG
jgi:hypothetical protein